MSFAIASRFRTPVWLFAIAVTLTAWQAMLVGRLGQDSNRQIVDLLFWGGVLLLLWQKRQKLNLNSDLLSTALGVLLLSFLLFKCLSLFWFESIFLRLIPLVAPLGLALLASGWHGLRQYWREFFILGLLAFPFDSKLDSWIEHQTKLEEVTAAIAHFGLHYIGFTVARQGITLHLPNGSVLVGYLCTGGGVMVLLLKLSLLFILLFPLTWRWRANMVLASLGIGLAIGVVRVGLLALVVSDRELFDYWHGGPGNQIFSLIAMALYGVLCYFLHENIILPLEAKQTAAAREKPEEGASAEPSSLFADLPFRPQLLAVIWASLALVTAYTFLVPTAGNRPVTTFLFPAEVNLSGWQFLADGSRLLPTDSALTSRNLARAATADETEVETEGPRADLVRAAREYRYLRDGLPLRAELRYIVGTLGDTRRWLWSKSVVGHVKEREERQLAGIGTHDVFVSEERAYLSSCINSRGNSTVSIAQFLANRRQHDLTLGRTLPWLLGRESLRDRRCLWVLLSVPLGEIETDPQVSYRQLELAWEAGYSRWRSLFPPH